MCTSPMVGWWRCGPQHPHLPTSQVPRAVGGELTEAWVDASLSVPLATTSLCPPQPPLLCHTQSLSWALPVGSPWASGSPAVRVAVSAWDGLGLGVPLEC